MKQNKKTSWVAAVVIVAILVVVTILDNLPSSIVPSMLMTVLKKGAIYALVAVSMNLLNGFTGLFSLGQAGFMLLGAYTYAALNVSVAQQQAVYQRYPNGGLGFSMAELLPGGFGTVVGVLISLVLAGLVAAFFAYLIGLPVLKLKSDYLAIATLGFAEIIRALVQYEKFGPVTNGSNLLYGFPSFTAAKIGPVNLSTVAPFILSIGCILMVVMLINSTYGRAFKAIRDDEIAAEAMGINLAKHKRMAFVISSFFAGVSGAMLAMYQATVQANTFKAAFTYELLLIVVIGGIGSISGSCLASFLYVACSEWALRFLDEEVTLSGFNAKLTFTIVFAMVVLGIVALILWNQKRKGKPLVAKVTNGDQVRTVVNGPAMGAVVVAALVLAWDIWFLISPALKMPLLRSGFRMVAFSAIIMVVVLFFRRGIMGDREFWDSRKPREKKAKAGAGK